ncbi:MAG: ATP-dependent dethiobiotin synthetase BioD [Burkholderiales bacterium]|nr:ATP-dependent dethiobiotin synthetase BioD [Burkholderiales bacterium]
MTAGRFVVAGTDTGVGKTVFAAGLARLLNAAYFKPVQAGLDGETDTETVRRLTRLPQRHFLPCAYRLRMPASPHIAARAEGVEIDAARLAPPADVAPLVVELAGGLMVPLTSERLFIDLLAGWGLPVILCARTGLGTINHSLLSLEALRRRSIPVQGIAFIGESNPGVEHAIERLGAVRRLGCLPPLAPLDRASLAAAFERSFRRADFGG